MSPSPMIGRFGDEKKTGSGSGNRQLIINISIIAGVFLGIIILAVALANIMFIPLEHTGDASFKLLEQNYARIYTLGGKVLHKEPTNSSWQRINRNNAHMIFLKEGDKVSTIGNESYLVFELDEKSRFLLSGDCSSLIFEKFDKAGEILFNLERGDLKADVDDTRGYKIRIILADRTEIQVTGTRFGITSTRRESRISVASGSVVVSSRDGIHELVSAGRQICSLEGKLQTTRRIMDPSLRKPDPVLMMLREEKEQILRVPRKAGDKTITEIPQAWASWTRKGITGAGTAPNCLKGKQFRVSSTRRKSRISVSSGSLSVSSRGASKYGMQEVIEAGYEISSLKGKIGTAGRITDPTLMKLDPALRKAREGKEKTLEERREEWEKAITEILQTWAWKGITDVGTMQNRLYLEPPGYTEDTITIVMGLYVGRVWGKAAPVKFTDLSQINIIRARKFTFQPTPGNRTYEKILDRLFVRAGVKEATLLFEKISKLTGKLEYSVLTEEQKKAANERFRAEAEKKERERLELLGVLSPEKRITFRAAVTDDYVKTSVFHGVLKLHGLQAEEDEENYSIPAGTAFTYWIRKPQGVKYVYQPQDLGVDDLLAYAALKEQFWELDTGVTTEGEETAEKVTGEEDTSEEEDPEKRKLEGGVVWEEETRQGLNIEFKVEGLFAVVNFTMNVTFGARAGPALPQRDYPCFMFFTRDSQTDGTKPEHWKAFLGGYRTYSSGKY